MAPSENGADWTGRRDASAPARSAAADVSGHPWHRFVALGDSFTEGFGDPQPGSPGGYRGWADRVAEELSAHGGDFAYANLAVRGLLLRQVVEQQLAAAVALNPDLISFQAGGNDLIHPGSDPDRLAEILDPAVERLASTGATVMLFVGPDSGRATVLGRIRSKIAIYNENVRAIAERHGALVADLWALSQLADPQMWDADRLHLSPLGHHTVAAMVLDTLDVDHALAPQQANALPVQSWRQARADDLVWTREYFVPWVLRGIKRRAAVNQGPPAKRPLAGPVYGPSPRPEEDS